MLLTLIFLELAQAPAIGMLVGIDDMVGFGEVNLILVTNNLTLRLSLKAHFHNVARFVVEKTMGISQPRNCTEKYAIKKWLEIGKMTRRVH